jgi:hypothetical protein
MRLNINNSALRIGFVIAVVSGMLTSCAYDPDDKQEQASDAETDSNIALEDLDYEKRDTIFGKGGLTLFDSKPEDNSGGALGVNFYLWRASLVTISSMPLTSADPFGGVIITDWHTYPEAPSERVKLTVYIFGKQLRADGVLVRVFRQFQDDRTGKWKDNDPPNEIGVKIEDAILMEARQLRNQSVTN